MTAAHCANRQVPRLSNMVAAQGNQLSKQRPSDTHYTMTVGRVPPEAGSSSATPCKGLQMMPLETATEMAQFICS